MNTSWSDGTGAPRGRAGGFTDWLPGDAARRRAVGDAFLDTFSAWGYDLVATPLVEPVDTIGTGVGASRQTELFRFMDADGSLLALVGERTVSVARVVATQLRDRPRPLRLCYAGPVVRNQPLLGGRRREAVQAGCELVGAAGLAADAECAALAAAALQAAGVVGVQIDVGHADFLPGLLDSAGLPEDAQSGLLSSFAARDLVAVEEALAGTQVGDAERALLLDFPTLRGGRELIAAASARLVGKRPRRALEELGLLWDLLMAHGLEGAVHLDLGAVRDWDYYTGPTFELFSGELGFPLGTGGRYDHLLGALGLPLPATGFVLHVDRCCDALARSGGRADETGMAPVAIGYAPEQAVAVAGVAAQLRRAGIAVTAAVEATDAPAAGMTLFVESADRARWRLGDTWQRGTVSQGVAALLGLGQRVVPAGVS